MELGLDLKRLKALADSDRSLRRQLSMQCPSCGAISKKRSLKCPQCGAFRNKSSVASSERLASIQTPIAEAADAEPRSNSRPSRSLIEFPGVKHSIPQWRKDLGERVREVQERRLRESSSENLANETQSGNDLSKAPLLELLPQAEAEPLNPIVVAALRRIERAHTSAQAGGNYANYQGEPPLPMLNNRSSSL